MEMILLPIPKKNNAKKCKEFRTISLISHTAKIFLRILNRRLHSRGKNNWKKNSLVSGRKMYKRCNWIDLNKRRKIYIEKDRDVYAVFVDLEKAFDRVDWKKLMGRVGFFWF